MSWREVFFFTSIGLSPGLATPAGPLAMDWQAPAGCPRTEEVENEVIRLAQLGPNSPHRVVARARVQRQPDGGFLLLLTAHLDGVGGERRLEGQSCRSVTEAAILTLALMLNPEAEIPEPEAPALAPAKTPTKAPREPSPAPPRPPSSTETTSGPRWPIQWSSLALVGLRTGVLPDPGLELALGGGLQLGKVASMLVVSAMPSQSAPVAGNPGARGKLWVSSGRWLVGWQESWRALQIGVSLGAEFTRIGGEGVGVAEPSQAAIYWASTLLGTTASYWFSDPIGVVFGLQALAPLARPRFFIEGAGHVHQPEPLGIRGHLGLGLRLP